MNNKNTWNESLAIIENIISDFGIYDVIAKISREKINVNIYRAKISKNCTITFGDNDNEKLLLVIKGSCKINDYTLHVGDHLYIPGNFGHTLITNDEGLEILVIKFKSLKEVDVNENKQS
jgi:redox-sensitive bicupin YhaK (pirin superfamily)